MSASSISANENPFAGYAQQPVRCRWLTPKNAEIAPSAGIIRLIVDKNRWSDSGWSNEVYNRAILREVSEFIGPTSAVIATPAGLFTTVLNQNLSTFEDMISPLQQCIDRLEIGSSSEEFLVGIDGGLLGSNCQMQTVVHFAQGVSFEPSNIAFKVYPQEKEKAFLAGWRICEELGVLPAEAMRGHLVQSRAGSILVLVCHEAILFSGRSQSNLRHELGVEIREFFRRTFLTDPQPRYILIASHCQDSRSGPFLNAIRQIRETTESTVLLTTHAPKELLAQVAGWFPPQGPHAGQIATLLVEDTLDG